MKNISHDDIYLGKNRIIKQTTFFGIHSHNYIKLKLTDMLAFYWLTGAALAWIRAFHVN